MCLVEVQAGPLSCTCKPATDPEVVSRPFPVPSWLPGISGDPITSSISASLGDRHPGRHLVSVEATLGIWNCLERMSQEMELTPLSQGFFFSLSPEVICQIWGLPQGGCAFPMTFKPFYRLPHLRDQISGFLSMARRLCSKESVD